MLVWTAAAAALPHIVAISLDDVGFADGTYNPEVTDIPTPHIATLMSEGLRMTRMYTQMVCSPTRSSFLTGLYPFRFGFQQLNPQAPASSATVPTSVPFVSDRLRAVGYATAAVGKWHVGYASPSYTPTYRGFDSFLGYYLDSTDYYNYTENFRLGVRNTAIVGTDFVDGITPVAPAYLGGYNLDALQRRAIQVIRDAAAGSKPLYLYLAYMNAHVPLEPPPPERVGGRCDGVPDPHRKVYCGMMVVLDDAVGGIVAELRAQGMWATTLLTISTDNGGMPDYKYATTTPDAVPFPAAAGSNWPLRAGKGTLFEGGVRAGVAAVSGGLLPPTLRGLSCPMLAHAVDLPVTALAAAGVAAAGLDGRDIVAAAQATNCSAHYALRESLPLNLLKEGASYSAIISRNLKLITGGTSPAGYDGWWRPGSLTPDMPLPAPLTQALFDLDADPYERTDLAASRPADVARLLAEAAGWVASGYREAQRNNIAPWAFPAFNGGAWSPFLPADGGGPGVVASAWGLCRPALRCEADCLRARARGGRCECVGRFAGGQCQNDTAAPPLERQRGGEGAAAVFETTPVVVCDACVAVAECDALFTAALCDGGNAGMPAGYLCTCPGGGDSYTCPTCPSAAL